MAKTRKICFDRVLGRDLRRQQMTRSIGGRTRAIAPINRQWVNGSTLKIRLDGGSAGDRALVEQTAPRWTQFANLQFKFTEDPRAEIRVTFDESDGAWSYIGLDNLDIPLHAATLNLGWVDDAVILHEFGHMIGLAHEHSSPMGGITWNRDAVIADLSGPPNYWDLATIEHNVFFKYASDQIRGTDFDADSIMLYAFPPGWTAGGTGTHENKTLSAQDKAFVASAQMYPKIGGQPEGNAQDIIVQSPVEAGIGVPGGENLFRFQVKNPGIHMIETSGPTDVVLSLFGPDSLTTKIAEDDDGGVSYNARIRASLANGAYYARVRHYSDTGTGAFSIRVTAI